MEPAPKKIRAKVPINSATSFCEMLYMKNSSQDGKEDAPDSDRVHSSCNLAGNASAAVDSNQRRKWKVEKGSAESVIGLSGTKAGPQRPKRISHEFAEQH